MIDWDSLVLAPLMSIFGEATQATYTPKSGAGAFSIDGVFDRAYKDLTILEGDPGFNSLGPVLGVRLAQFASPPLQGDTVTIASVGLTYMVGNVQSDGHGWCKLRLNSTT